MTPVHWDDVPQGSPPWPGVGGVWRALGHAAGATGVGLNRIELAAGEVSTPAHTHASDEEVFFVLAGSGLALLDGATHEIRPGDCLVHRPRGPAHTLRAGDGGLDVLAYGTRTPAAGSYQPKLGTYWVMGTQVWAEVNPGQHPFDRDQRLEWPEPGPRPESIVNLDDVEPGYGGRFKGAGHAAGATRSGLNWLALQAGESGAPPHCHSAEEEVFVVLDGAGVLELWDRPKPGGEAPTEPSETHPVRRGSVVARPPGTRVSHSFCAGEGGLTFLAYGTREPNDICWYPRSNKIFFRGVGVIGRLELLEYSDGEPD